MDRMSRLDRVREQIREAAADVMLVTKPENVRYLSGFAGTGWLLVPSDGDPTLLTDRRYEGRAEQELAIARVEATVSYSRRRSGAGFESLMTPGSSLALEADYVTMALVTSFESELPEVSLVPTTGLIEQLRVVKDDGEIARLRLAAEIVSRVLSRVDEVITPGMTEQQAAKALNWANEEEGGEGPAFKTLVASGPNTSYPHWTPSERVIQEGELVLVDCGTSVDGYLSDVARTFSFGSTDARSDDVLGAAQQAHAEARTALSSGATYRAVDEVARTSITDSGFAAGISHPTGHNVGLEIHEHPFLAQDREETIGSAKVVTIEPGVYLQGVVGARIEDMYVVTESDVRCVT